MRNTLLTIVIISSLATASMAADRRDDGQQQSKQAEQTQAARGEQRESKQADTQVARNDAGKSSNDDHASSGKKDCTPKPEATLTRRKIKSSTVGVDKAQRHDEWGTSRFPFSEEQLAKLTEG